MTRNCRMLRGAVAAVWLALVLMMPAVAHAELGLAAAVAPTAPAVLATAPTAPALAVAPTALSAVALAPVALAPAPSAVNAVPPAIGACRPAHKSVLLQSTKVRWAISPCYGGMAAVTLLERQFELPARVQPVDVPDWAKSKFSAGSLDLIETWDARWDPFRDLLLRAQVVGAVRHRATGATLADSVKAYRDLDSVWAVTSADAASATLVWPDPTTIDSPLYLAKTWRLGQADQPYTLQLHVSVVNVSAQPAEVVVAHDITTFQHGDADAGGMMAIFGAPPDLKGTAVQVGEETLHLDAHSLPTAEVADRTRVGLPGWIGAESRYFLLASAPVSGFAAQNDLRMQSAPSGVLVSRLTLAPATLAAGAAACTPPWLAAGQRPKCGDLSKENHVKTWSYNIFTGPKDHDQLAAFGHQLVQGLDFGWFGAIALPMLFVLQFGFDLTGSWPVAILLLTLLVKLLLWPITMKSMRSMKMMGKLKPELDKLRADIEARAVKLGKASDPQEINRATFELYKQHGVNPVGGCLPLLLQMPVYIALYRSINASVSLYNQPLFGWIGDMTQKDPYYILPLVLGAVMFVQQKITPQAGGDPAQQKIMLYFMPALFTVMMLGLPSGLTLYILINTLLSVVQTWAMQRDDLKPAPTAA